MTDQTATRELTHLLRNLDSLVRLRLAVGDRVEDVARRSESVAQTST